ncbi:hypothetical protein [Rhodococcus rhodochrous]|uniref:hypothetical protein n=1 Tax=Rhodococcus rhodochrous TaxID=1829 RepID=UPI00188CFF4A|nr:hypothetical protein [Rhodococcus rhodochrous]MBF4478270.1 hypothetical protein [Rhodococcus rhodochrous]
MFVPDRLNLGGVVRDFSRSLKKYKSEGRRDWGTSLVLVLVPLAVAAVTVVIGFVFPAPVALLPAVALLAGVLLSAAGQVITLRARIADSLTLSADERVVGHLRETMSGLVLSAVAAFLDALLLGSLAASINGGGPVRWWHEALSSAAMGVTAFLTLMFIVAARRLYQTYLEVFEHGTSLPKIGSTLEQRLAERSSDKRHHYVERGSL